MPIRERLRRRHLRAAATQVVLALLVAGGGCGRTGFLVETEPLSPFDVDGGRPDTGPPRGDLAPLADLAQPADLTVDAALPEPDLAQPPPPPDLFDPDLSEPDLTLPPDLLVLNPCGNFDPGCGRAGLGQPLPVPGDPMSPAGTGGNNVERDRNSQIILSQTTNQLQYLWVAGTNDVGGRGTISKIDSRTVKEVARYLTVTCYSTPQGSRAACDGTRGCCAGDDFIRFQDRQNGRPESARQAVQVTANYPSRTALDWNGDAWVANRAFGGQSSVSKIANSLTACTDWNKDGVVQTSSDANNDGVIDVDCNNNGVPDDIADVKARPCANGLRAEFYGLDDECLLFTVNTNNRNTVGRPLTLQPGITPTSASDAWAGSYNDGRFLLIDGKGGFIRQQAFGPVGAYGAVVDKEGILWIAVLADGRLSYIDTNNVLMSGRTRAASFALSAYGLSLDRAGNIWQAGWTTGNAYRYTPVRGGGFAQLGQGLWTVVQNPGSMNGATGNARGIAADNRSQNAFFVWMARDAGWIVRVDGNVPLPVGVDSTVNGAAYPAIRVAGTGTIGAGLDNAGNVWGVSYDQSVATRIKVDATGKATPPDVVMGPANVGCPAGLGDRCTLAFKNDGAVNPYTYSDFSGYGLRNFTQPKGSWTFIVDSKCPNVTEWISLSWVGVVPPNTTLLAKARSGKTPTPDMTWSDFSPPTNASPAVLTNRFNVAGRYLQVQFDFASTDGINTPALRSFDVLFQCR